MDASSSSVKLGWLWLDNDPKTDLEQKLNGASSRYQQKFGRSPRVCYVNRAVLGDSSARYGRLQVCSAANVHPGHFLFVIEDNGAAQG